MIAFAADRDTRPAGAHRSCEWLGFASPPPRLWLYRTAASLRADTRPAARLARWIDCGGRALRLRCRNSPAERFVMKKLLVILILVAIGVAVAKKVRDSA
jgi:hypothetical protein